VSEPVGAFALSVVGETSGAQTSISAPGGGIVSRTVPGSSTIENVLIDAAAGSVMSLGGRQWTVSADRKSITAIA
jgi:hypothetical protein